MVKIFEKRELKLLWPFYLEQFLASALMLFPAFMIVYFIGLNFTLFQISLLTAALSLSILIFEIPTGAIADIYGRKFPVMIGYLLEGLVLLSLIFIARFNLLIFIFIFWGFAKTLSSGSKEAWVTDLIKRQEDKYLHIFFMKEDSIKAAGLIIAGIIGALLVKSLGISVIWIVSSASYFTSFFLLIFVKNIQEEKEINFLKPYTKLKNQIKESYYYIRNHGVLFYFLLAGFFLAISVTFGENMTWVPLLKGLNFPDYAFGYMWSALSGIFMIAPLLSKKLLKIGKEKRFIIIYTLIPTIILLMIYFASSWLIALLILFTSSFFFSMREPVRRVYFQKFIPSKMRATIGSFHSMIFSLAGIISLPIAGYLIDIWGAKYVILISAITIIPAIIFYSLMEERSLKKLSL